MTPSGMEELTTPSEPYSPPPASTRVSVPPPAWRTLFESRERRWWTIALTAALLITAFGIGVLYVDDSSNQAAVRSLTTQNESLTGRNLILQDQLKTIYGILSGAGTPAMAQIGIGPFVFLMAVSLAGSLLASFLYLQFYSSRATGSQVYRAFPHLPILGMGGIRDGLDALQFILAGASAVSVGTAVFVA